MSSLLETALATCGRYRLVEEIVRATDDALVTRSHLPLDADYHRTDGAGTALLVPGTVLMEHAVQSGEVLIHGLRGRPAADGVPVLARIKRAAFRRPVAPGATLVVEVRLEEQVGPAFYVGARARVGDEIVMNAQLVFTATTAIAVAAPGGDG